MEKEIRKFQTSKSATSYMAQQEFVQRLEGTAPKGRYYIVCQCGKREIFNPFLDEQGWGIGPFIFDDVRYGECPEHSGATEESKAAAVARRSGA